ADTAGLGYLLKDRVADVEEFLAAVHTVGDGGTALDPEVVSQILVRSRRTDELATLTTREREVLAAMAAGASNRTIAGQLHITAGAVEKHISSIFTKLDLSAEDTGNRRVLAVLRYLRQPNLPEEPR